MSSLEILSTHFLTNHYLRSITSILTCRFILSLRQFDNTLISATFSELNTQIKDHQTEWETLQFASHPSNNLPSFIVSFAHPVHISTSLSEEDRNGGWNGEDEKSELREINHQE